MQTDSLLTESDRERIALWPGMEVMIDPIMSRVARELARLEQENQRLQTENTDMRLASVGLDAFASVPKDAHVQKDRDVIARLEQENRRLRVESDAIKASMFSVLNALKLGDHVRPQSWSEVVSDEIVPAIERLTTENTDLKEAVSNLEVIVRSWRSHWEAEHEQLATTRAEVATLRAEAEKPHEHSPKIKERQDQLILDGILERISTLEGRVQGILDSLRQDSPPFPRPSALTARNPFEDLRPPRGL